MFAKLRAAPTGFDANQLDAFVADKRVEQADGIAAPADAGVQRIRQAALSLKNLGARLNADHTMKVADHDWIRMCTQRGTEEVISIVDVGHPVAHGFADGVL